MQRCKAKSKKSGERCKNYAVRGSSVCRMHGAGGGPKTEEGLRKCRRAPLKHGCYTESAQAELKEMQAMLCQDEMLMPVAEVGAIERSDNSST